VKEEAMKVVRYEDVEAFYRRVEPYLLPLEAEHNLTFGLLSYIRRDPARYPDRLLRLVEDEAGEIQLVAIRTDQGRGLILSLAQALEAVALLADDLYASGVVLHGSNGPVEESAAFAEAWTRASGQPHHVAIQLRTFKLEKVKLPTGVPGHLRRAEPSDRNLLIEWEIAFRREAFAMHDIDRAEVERFIEEQLTSPVRGLYVWEDGEAVSVAGYAGPTPHGIRIGPVYTPPENRGKGYASACTAEMSQRLLDEGREFCFLFTDLANPTSNHIYQEIGYEPVCDFTEYKYGG
jgi:predicted GNAT family acetyltransferase